FGDVISINAEAQDADGTITQVEFFNGTSHIGTLSSEPFTFVWGNAPLGNHSIIARATDDKGAVAISSPINIQVNEKTNIAPTINITSPSNNSTFTFGDVISINAEAQDADGTITQVEFFNGTSHIGTLSSEPFTFVWDNAPLGNHSITARATDDKGAVENSSSVNIQIIEKEKNPSFKIISPEEKINYYRDDQLLLNVEISEESSEIVKVEYFRNNIFIGSRNDGNYAYNWRISIIGDINITAIATDVNGKTASDARSIQVTERPKETLFVEITSPSNNSTFIYGENIVINADVLDPTDNETRVEFFQNNILIGESHEFPYQVVWINPPLGKHTLIARVSNNRGNNSYSNPVSINVVQDESIPEIELISPISDQIFDFDENVDLMVMFNGDTKNVKRIEYYAGNKLIASAEEYPYFSKWEKTNPGDHMIFAKIIGNDPNKYKQSNSNKITIKNELDESVFRIISPTTLSEHSIGTDLEIKVQIPNSNKPIEKVEYYRGNTLIGSSNIFPYNFIWENAPLGEVTLISRLVYSDGSILISLPIRIHIKEVPQIILKIEQGKHEFVSSENITFKPEFLHFIHEIALVEIFVNGSSINKIESQPFSFDLTNLAFGIHEIWIEALDKNGNRYISEIIEITIKETSFEEYLELTDFKFGPNPTVRYLNLFFGNIAEEFNVKASIFSLNGNLVKSYEFLMNSNEVTLDLENLISGTYLLRIQFNGNLIASKRFVKHY
ncbi:Ig-like domain-containing protein, partial [Belliella sp. DSM 111904]